MEDACFIREHHNSKRSFDSISSSGKRTPVHRMVLDTRYPIYGAHYSAPVTSYPVPVPYTVPYTAPYTVHGTPTHGTRYKVTGTPQGTRYLHGILAPYIV